MIDGEQPASVDRPPTVFRILGWCVHAYTALGLIAAAGIAVCILEGSAEAFRRAFLLMVAATLIDATDGALARRVRITEVVPSFDGRRLDDLIDFLTYTFLPLLLIWRAELLPPGWSAWLLVPLVASAYGFCQVQAKTPDGYFLGFPSYWNLVAFYFYAARPLPPWFSLSLLLVLSVLTFVPSRYLYPTQPGRLNRITGLLGAAWAVLLVWILWHMPSRKEEASLRGWLLLSLIFPAWYLAASWYVSVRYWRGGGV